jgi:hypothetical protein
MLSVTYKSFVQSVSMPSDVMPNVVMLSVMVPNKLRPYKDK